MRILEGAVWWTTFVVAVVWRFRTAVAQCSSLSARVGYQADFVMVQHQLRGSFRIVDDCSFTVSLFCSRECISVFKEVFNVCSFG